MVGRSNLQRVNINFSVIILGGPTTTQGVWVIHTHTQIYVYCTQSNMTEYSYIHVQATAVLDIHVYIHVHTWASPSLPSTSPLQQHNIHVHVNILQHQSTLISRTWQYNRQHYITSQYIYKLVIIYISMRQARSGVTKVHRVQQG